MPEADPVRKRRITARPVRRHLPGTATPWLPVGALTLMVASDYKFRVRPVGSTSADSSVLLEVAIYGLVATFLIWRYVSPIRLRRRMPKPMYFLTVYVLSWWPRWCRPRPGRSPPFGRRKWLSYSLLAWTASIRGSRKAFADLTSSFLVHGFGVGVPRARHSDAAIPSPKGPLHLATGSSHRVRRLPEYRRCDRCIILSQTNSRPARSIMRVPICVFLLADRN